MDGSYQPNSAFRRFLFLSFSLAQWYMDRKCTTTLAGVPCTHDSYFDLQRFFWRRESEIYQSIFRTFCPWPSSCCSSKTRKMYSFVSGEIPLRLWGWTYIIIMDSMKCFEESTKNKDYKRQQGSNVRGKSFLCALSLDSVMKQRFLYFTRVTW